MKIKYNLEKYNRILVKIESGDNRSDLSIRTWYPIWLFKILAALLLIRSFPILVWYIWKNSDTTLEYGFYVDSLPVDETTFTGSLYHKYF